MHKRKLHISYEGSDSTATSVVHEIKADGVYEKDFEVLKSDNGKPLPLSIQLPFTLAILITASCAMRLRIGKQVLPIDQNNPIVWFLGGNTPCPILEDVDEMRVDVVANDPVGGGILRVRIPESNKRLYETVTIGGDKPTLPFAPVNAEDATVEPAPVPSFNYVPTGQAVVELEPAAAA